ncbi:ATP-binding cassette domain-containing protein [Liquorilactobacillus mali]|uniref:ABC transporter ATP-binding protein/permease n=1 Tax=Liquorilactobacillus mali TaxID=1618 RepID=UPI0023505D13|nr:ABC transporter ATP-binding protein/permease [Liquorilactobacillus mali]MDC7952828.1 ATP-binding cassette domain-containing protein [Liquorilactobacillus mali]
MSFLELKDIHKSYFIGQEEFPVLHGIDLKFTHGEFVSILGESGGGKSTLMNIIGGLDRKFQGEVLVNGQKLDHSKEDQLDKYRREVVGYIYQAYNLISHLTVLDNVLISLDMTTLSRKEREERAVKLLTEVGLEGQVKKYPNQLSGGQKQRVAIARALASDPQVIIADEPTGALDAQNTQEVLEILNKIAAQGKLVITVTHSQEVAQTGTRIINLVDGKVEKETNLRKPYAIEKENTQIKPRKLPLSVPYQTAFKHLKYNLSWNSLIILGTAIGLFAVMLFNGLGNGIKGYINDQVNSLVNPQSITVTRYTKSDSSSGGGISAGESSSSQTASSASTATVTSTADALKKQLESTTFSSGSISRLAKVKNVTKADPGFNASNVIVKIGSKSLTASSVSTWTNSNRVANIKVGNKPGKNEIVLDKATVAKKWSNKNWKKLVGKKVTVSFAETDLTGKSVTVTRKLTVSGITSSSTGSGTNATNYSTMKSMRKAANVSLRPQFVDVKINSRSNVKTAATSINKIKVNGKRNYSATSMGSILDTINTYVSLATTVLAAIAGISLLVSALMIIVTMFMSVSARTKEIGILRALGESKRDIRRLFTSEALMIGVISATLATGIAYGIGAIANSLLYGVASYNFVQIALSNVVLTFIIAVVISLLAAILPARRAARLNPIDALAAD